MTQDSSTQRARPDISLVMPCYNEEASIGYTIPRLFSAFEEAGYRLELVAVDNGSWDRTGEMIAEFQTQHQTVLTTRVEDNIGYGNGLLHGFPLCTAPWIGTVPADGQVDAEDIVRLYEAVMSADIDIMGKVRRRFRMDGMRRKIVSIAYNVYVRSLWPTLESLDVNGIPKLLRREAIGAMNLKSTGWLLDPEIMVKAHYMGIKVLELNSFARMRGSGVSHVKIGTLWEFFSNLLHVRLTRRWRRDIDPDYYFQAENVGMNTEAIAEDRT